MNRNILIGIGAVAGVLVVGVAALGVTVAMQPDQLNVEREIIIAAAPADVHAAVSDFKHFPTWSPWDADPDMEITISEPSTGVGATYEWKGNDEVGAGKMTFTSIEPMRIEEDLEFIQPMAGHSQVVYLLEPEGEGTRLTWEMHQPLDFPAKAFGMVIDIEGMVGADFDKGLGRIKSQVESGEIGAPKPADDADAGAAAGGPTDGAMDTDSAMDTDAGMDAEDLDGEEMDGDPADGEDVDGEERDGDEDMAGEESGGQ